MHHLLLSLLFLVVALFVLYKITGIEQGYRILALLPVSLSGLAIGYEISWGFQRFAEIAWHFSYDTSYLLMLVGMLLIRL